MSFRRLRLKVRNNSFQSDTDTYSMQSDLPIYSSQQLASVDARPPTYYVSGDAYDSGLDVSTNNEGSIRSLPSIPSTPSIRAYTGNLYDVDPPPIQAGAGVFRSHGSVSTRSGTGEEESRTPPALEQHYVYYRIFGPDGARPSKSAAFPTQDPHLGRILATRVQPPHTVSNLKKCILHIENIGSVESCALYQDITSPTPMDEGHLSLLSDDGPGRSANKAIALVYTALENKSREDEIRLEDNEEEWQPVNIRRGVVRGGTVSSVAPSVSGSSVQSRTQPSPAQAPPQPVSPSSVPKRHWKFTKKIKAKHSAQASLSNPKYLDHKEGEIFYTDGKSHWEVFAGGSGGGRSAVPRYKAYRAVNCLGSEGLILKSSVDFID